MHARTNLFVSFRIQSTPVDTVASNCSSCDHQPAMEENRSARGAVGTERYCFSSFRQESVKSYLDLSIITLVMVGHLLQPKEVDRLVYRSYFCAGSRAVLVLPDQVCTSCSWKYAEVLRTL